MDRSESSDAKHLKSPLPRRRFSLEFFVGIFTMIGVASAAYLAVNLGGLTLSDAGTYKVVAEFDNVSGLKYGASVEIAGVQIGEVTSIDLKDPEALVTLKIDERYEIRDEDIAAIRTKGIIGDRYVKVSRGGSDKPLASDGKITDTESVVDIEDLIGKIVHNLSGGDDEKDEGTTEESK